MTQHSHGASPRMKFGELEQARYPIGSASIEGATEIAVLSELIRQLIGVLQPMTGEMGRLEVRMGAVERQGEMWEQVRQPILGAAQQIGPVLERVARTVDMLETGVRAQKDVFEKQIGEVRQMRQSLTEARGSLVYARGRLHWTLWGFLLAGVLAFTTTSIAALSIVRPYWMLSEQDYHLLQEGKKLQTSREGLTPEKRQSLDEWLSKAEPKPR